MKKLALALALVVAASSAVAETVHGTVISVTPNYVYTRVDVPYQSCIEQDVPVYGTVRTAPSTGDVLAGAIIGGAIGNQFGSGSGQDAMTVLGAIVGANSVNSSTRQEVIGYRTEVTCTTQYQTENQQYIEDYTVVVRWGNNTSTIYTEKHYAVGDRVRLQIR